MKKIKTLWVLVFLLLLCGAIYIGYVMGARDSQSSIISYDAFVGQWTYLDRNDGEYLVISDDETYRIQKNLREIIDEGTWILDDNYLMFNSKNTEVWMDDAYKILEYHQGVALAGAQGKDILYLRDGKGDIVRLTKQVVFGGQN